MIVAGLHVALDLERMWIASPSAFGKKSVVQIGPMPSGLRYRAPLIKAQVWQCKAWGEVGTRNSFDENGLVWVVELFFRC